MSPSEREAEIDLHERWIETLTLMAEALRQFQTFRTLFKAHEITRRITQHQAQIDRLKKLAPAAAGREGEVAP